MIYVSIKEHEVDYLKHYIKTLNAFYLTIKYITKWPREEMNFLDANKG